jgi:hypothetical protein
VLNRWVRFRGEPIGVCERFSLGAAAKLWGLAYLGHGRFATTYREHAEEVAVCPLLRDERTWRSDLGRIDPERLTTGPVASDSPVAPDSLVVPDSPG